MAEHAFALPAAVLEQDRRALEPVLGVKVGERELADVAVRRDPDQRAAGVVDEQDAAVEARHRDEVGAVLDQRDERLRFFLGALALAQLGLQRLEQLRVGDRERGVVGDAAREQSIGFIERRRVGREAAHREHTEPAPADLERHREEAADPEHAHDLDKRRLGVIRELLDRDARDQHGFAGLAYMS